MTEELLDRAEADLKNEEEDDQHDLQQQQKQQQRTHNDLALTLLKSDLSKVEMLDELITLLGAGHETTAALLTFSIYLLSQHPECMAKVRDEIDAVLGDRDDFTYEDTLKLDYLNQVFKETMRMFPPVPFIAKEAIVDTAINGLAIPKACPRVFSYRASQH